MEEKANNKSKLEIDLRELLNQLWINRRIIIKFTVLALVIGLIIGFSIPKEYTCTVKMAPEGTKSSITGNVSDLAAIAGINIGAVSDDGINISLYPDVIQSMPFLAELINMNLAVPKENKKINLYTYLKTELKYPWWRNVATFPFRLINNIGNKNETESPIGLGIYNLTRKQDRLFEVLKKRISISIDKKTGVITSRVTLQDPLISALVADTLVANLEDFIISYRTNKAKQDFDFALEMFNEAKSKYYLAQRNYAQFVDEHRNIVLQSVLIEQERMKNEQSLSYNVYSTLAQQVEKARLKVQEQTPCVTVIEPARVPTKKSNISKLNLLILFCIVGGLSGILRVMYLKWNIINISQ
jgi:uncharacterized protein involved in exopolysaccharide biosynthesis